MQIFWLMQFTSYISSHYVLVILHLHQTLPTLPNNLRCYQNRVILINRDIFNDEALKCKLTVNNSSLAMVNLLNLLLL